MIKLKKISVLLRDFDHLINLFAKLALKYFFKFSISIKFRLYFVYKTELFLIKY